MSTAFTHTTDGRVFTGRTNLVPDLRVRSGAPLVIALHGGTYSSEYFDVPGHSLLDNASALGVPVIALDRPNHVGSSPPTSDDSIIAGNAEVIGGAIGSIRTSTAPAPRASCSSRTRSAAR